MENLNITSAQYIQDTKEDGNVHTIAIKTTIEGRMYSVPLDPANRHYAEIMRQVEAGTLVVAEAD